jgi:beta-lactamase superfamily II metal-dependent hydrolase
VAPGEARPLRVIFFDVGEGDALCIQTPGGKTILIDGGSSPYTIDDTVVQSREVAPLLQRRGITRIDAVVISHAHADHVSGLLNVIGHLPVGIVYDSGYCTDEDKEYRQLIELVREKGVPYRQVHAGELMDWGSDVTAEVFGPPDNIFSGPNNNSLIIKMSCCGISFLFVGDAQRDEELWAVGRYGGRLAADVLKVGHHGSGTSSSRGFLKAVHPRMAVISCGYDTPFGHPHSQTLFALKKQGIRVLRTDYDGDIVLQADGGRLSVETEKGNHVTKKR